MAKHETTPNKYYLHLAIIGIVATLLFIGLAGFQGDNLSGNAGRLPPQDPTGLPRYEGGPSDWSGTFKPYETCNPTAVDCPDGGGRLWVCSGGGGTAYLYRKAKGYPDYMRLCYDLPKTTENHEMCGSSGQLCCKGFPQCAKGSVCISGQCTQQQTKVGVGGGTKKTPLQKDPGQNNGDTTGIPTGGGGGGPTGTTSSTPCFGGVDLDTGDCLA